MLMNSLASLLFGQSSGSGVASRGNIPEDDEQISEILVQPEELDPESRYSPQDPPNRNLRNDMAILNRNVAAQKAEEIQKETPMPGRKGPFGTTGTLRDILGYLGDAFLMQGGADPVYGPRRKMERFSDSIAGQIDDPLGAIERAAGVDAPSAIEMHKEYLLNQDRMFDNAMAGQKEARITGDQQFGNLQDTIDYTARTLNAALKTGNAQLIQGAVAQAQAFAKEAGVPIEQILPLDQMSDEELAIVAQAGMTPYQQNRLPLEERRVATGERNATTGERRARAYENRPTNPTRASEESRVIQQVNERGIESLGEGDLLIYKRIQEQARPKSGGGSSFLEKLQEQTGVTVPRRAPSQQQQRSGPIIRPVQR